MREWMSRWLAAGLLGVAALWMANPNAARQLTRPATCFVHVFATSGEAASGQASVLERLVYSWIVVTAPQPRAQRAPDRA
jgi:hypothetical protein